MDVLYFGNEFIESDNFCHEIVEDLKKRQLDVNFIFCTDPINILSYIERKEDFFILDVATNISEVSLLTGCDRIKEKTISTSHDFDLNFFLKLTEQLENKIKLKIICIPKKGNPEKIADDVEKIFSYVI